MELKSLSRRYSQKTDIYWLTEMRIRTFCKLIEVSELQPMLLRDTTVVFDGLNHFYNTYEDSGLNDAFGCESDRYAAYLREHLTMFQKANIKCYFLFKGGHENIEKKLKKRKDKISSPVFMKDTHKEVLKEMGLDYVTCEYESKREIVALAQQLDCPIISYDIEYCFSTLKYIPRNELKFSEADNAIQCRYFGLENFLKKYSLNNDKMAIFIVLTDELIFPEDFFSNFFSHIRAPLGCFKRNLHLLRWLSKRDRKMILMDIYKFLSAEDRTTFSEEQDKALQMIGRQEPGGLGAATALKREAAAAARGDPRWFAKGVAAGHIAIDYINLYRSKHFFGCKAIVHSCYENAMLLSLDIIKYAYDLFTNFKNEGFIFVHELNGVNVDRELVTVAETHSIRKPEYEADVCVFENGWDGLRERGLFEHFLSETLCGAELGRLARAPADARLLLAALLYFTRKSPADTAAAAAAVLTSYVTLNVVLPKADKNNLPKFPFAVKPILDSTLDKNDVTEADCNIAAAILAEYRSASARDVREVDWAVYHPLTQFQHCLSQLNHLNVLCGAPYEPPLFHRTYNGTLVYRLARAARGDPTHFLDQLLGPAPTVYAFLNGLIDIYQEIV